MKNLQHSIDAIRRSGEDGNVDLATIADDVREQLTAAAGAASAPGNPPIPAGDPETMPVDLPEDDVMPPQIADRRDAENSEVEQLRAEVNRLRAQLDDEDALSRIIETRAERQAARSTAGTAFHRAVEALAEYLRDGSVSTVSRTVARPWLLGEHGAVAQPRPDDDPSVDRAEPGLDPDRLKALAFAVDAADSAVSQTRFMIGFRLERRAYALQLRGELDDIETGLRRLGDRDTTAPAYIAEHIRRSREILDELERYDAPIRDRGIGGQL